MNNELAKARSILSTGVTDLTADPPKEGVWWRIDANYGSGFHLVGEVSTRGECDPLIERAWSAKAISVRVIRYESVGGDNGTYTG